MALDINKKFEEALRKLTDSELADLEKDLLQNGCTDPIITCDGFIVDGHNRYSICNKLGIRYDVKEISSRSESDCMKFIRQKQRARRNLELGELQAMAKEDEGERKKLGKQKQGNDGKSLLPKSGKVNVVKETAKKAGIGATKQGEINFIYKHGNKNQIWDMEHEKRKVYDIWEEVKGDAIITGRFVPKANSKDGKAYAEYKAKIAALPKAKKTDWAESFRGPLGKIACVPLSIAESATPEEKREIVGLLNAGLKMLTRMKEAFGVFDKSDALTITSCDEVKPMVFGKVELL